MEYLLLPRILLVSLLYENLNDSEYSCKLRAPAGINFYEACNNPDSFPLQTASIRLEAGSAARSSVTRAFVTATVRLYGHGYIASAVSLLNAIYRERTSTSHIPKLLLDSGSRSCRAMSVRSS